MAVLEKLNILGIRSFGPKESETITFSTPLTLILGQNGCGKTTIIECLKYAITSEAPKGSDSGKGFLNDPKLSNKQCTKASIKLKFTDAKGDHVKVGKFLDVTETVGGGGNLRFRTLNSTIQRTDPDGSNKQDSSSRCINTDQYCCQILQVSKAILNNVIFCHQEYASWPLDEGQKLKNKFDEIFGSLEYNKCIEKLRKNINDRKKDIKLLKEQMQHKTTVKLNTEKLQMNLGDNQSKLENIEVFIETKKKEAEPLKQKLSEINDTIEVFTSTQKKLASLETELEGIKNNESSLKKHLKDEFQGSDEDLDSEIRNFDAFQQKTNENINDRNAANATLIAKIKVITQFMEKKQVHFGKLKQEEAEHLKRSSEEKDLIEQAVVKFNMILNQGEDFATISNKLETALDKIETKFHECEKSAEDEQKQLQKVIDDIRVKLAVEEESHSTKRKLIKENSEKNAEISLKISKLSTRSIQRIDVEKQLKEAQEILAKKKLEFNGDEALTEIQAIDDEIKEMEISKNKLEREHRILQENCLTEHEIETQTIQLNTKREEIDKLKKKNEEHFFALFENKVPEEDFQIRIKEIHNIEEKNVCKVNESISNCEKTIMSLETTVKNNQDTLKSYNEELKRNKNQIETLCKGDSFNEVLNQSYSKKEKLQKNKGAFRSAKTLYEEFIKEFEEESPCCPICTTDFSSKKILVPQIIEALKEKIEDLPKKLFETETSLKSEEELYDKLQQLKPVSENTEILEGVKIPLLEEELYKNNEKLEEAKLELAVWKNELTGPQSRLDICRLVLTDAVLLDRLMQEYQKTENLIANLKSKIRSVPSKRTFKQTDSELKTLNEKLRELTTQLKQKNEHYNENQDSIRHLADIVQSFSEKKMEYEKSVQEKNLLNEQFIRNKESNLKMEKEVKDLLQNIESVKKELNITIKKREELVQTHKKSLDEKRLHMEERKRLLSDIRKIHKIIEIYERNNNQEKLEGIQKELDDSKTNITKLETAKKELQDSILKLKEDLAGQESKWRNLNDNKELRSNREKREKLENQVKELRQQVGNHNSRSICNEQNDVMRKINQVQREIDQHIGKQNELKEMLRGFKLELNKKEHKESLTAYKHKFYELRVEELAIQDLEMYTNALEKSLLKFHEEKMVQINITIRDLWRSIYRGNDIDFIEIQTDDTIGGGKRRAYNYKVVQVKKGVKLSMAGRCSAGQKVLACLVIRMALAETFSANCGILALDEPTTNLDRDNIMSLSDALNRIITVREKQKHFQLIIITHDEEFLHSITRDHGVSHFFRVQRNVDGFSQIKKEYL
ncbi:hypothetical protein ABEB36_004248 [Hypothenemus hampei]|uniref:DNA repair protein RAD50 n=1 Tax=Hypothenemus hampei TaxID=57062 RepID=A0ABD1F5V2_HYPHA